MDAMIAEAAVETADVVANTFDRYKITLVQK